MVKYDKRLLRRIQKHLEYCPTLGIFIWKTSSRQYRPGQIAGRTVEAGYIQIGFEGNLYYAHRLAFLFIGKRPPRAVDHINRIKDDNRSSNLRPATRSLNGFNRDLMSSNKTGAPGIYNLKSGYGWQAAIKKNNKRIHLGTFRSKQEAVLARKAAEIQHYGEAHPAWKIE